VPYRFSRLIQARRAYNCASWRAWAHLVVWVPDGTSAITTYGIPKMPYGVIRAGRNPKPKMRYNLISEIYKLNIIVGLGKFPQSNI